VTLLKITLSILLCSSALLAYEDQDIDGVDDSKDLCADTPFDVIVDERGCPYDKKYPGKITLQLGSDISFNTLSATSSNLNLFVNYDYGHWSFSLSSSNYSTTNINTITRSENSLYFTAGYLFQTPSFNTKVSMGTKFYLTGDGTSGRDNDYFSSVNFDYFINTKQNIFFYYSYTISGDSPTMDYNNFYSCSAGTGYALTDKWYSALSYSYSGSAYSKNEAYKALSWFNAYTVSKDLFVTCNYAYTLDKLSYDHIISFNIGVHFE